MKKLKIFLLIFITVMLCGCTDTTKEKMVKAVAINKTKKVYELSVISYDFTNEGEAYLQEDFYGDDLDRLFITSLGENYNLKRCQYCFSSTGLIKSEANRVFSALNNAKFPSNINIICADIVPALNDFTLGEGGDNPLYNLKLNGRKVTGDFPIIDESGLVKGAVLISNGAMAAQFSGEEYKIIRLLRGEAKNITVNFGQGEYWASLKNIRIAFGNEKDQMQVRIEATLENYRGLSSGKDSRDLFVSLLKTELSNRIYLMYYDKPICSLENLKWYENQTGRTYKDVQVSLNII